MRRLVWLIWLLVLAPPARAQDFSATVTPQSVVYGQDTTVTWRITIRTQEQPADFQIRLGADGVSPAQHGAPGFRLTRLDAGAVRLEGPGSLQRGSMLISDPCHLFVDTRSRMGPPFEHGFDEDLSDYHVQVPANSESVLVVPTRTSRHAPWPGSTYGLAARIGERRLDLPQATVGGRTGVPLAIATDPAGSASLCSEPPRFAHGRPVVISGRTDPALAGDRLTLDWYPPADAPTQAIGDVVVQPDGRFKLDGWVPPPGEHAVAARYTTQRADRTDDFAHPQWFIVDEPGPAPPPPPPPAAVSAAALVGRPSVRGPYVTPRLHCRSEAGSCRGVLRLVRNGRRLAARRFVIAPATHARIPLRVSRSFVRTLRRRGRLAARVVVQLDGGDPVTHRVTLRRR